MAISLKVDSTEISRLSIYVVDEDALSIQEICSTVQEKSGAIVWVVLGDQVEGGEWHQVMIEGEVASVAVAKYEIEKLIDKREYKKKTILDVKVDQQKIVKYQQNQMTFEDKIDEQSIRINETRDNVIRSKKEIEREGAEILNLEMRVESNIVDRSKQSKVYFEMKLESKDVGGIIGKSGENIKAIRKKSRARIKIITKGGDNMVKITGSKENVAAARDDIQKIVYSRKVSFVMKVESQNVGRIIGKSGENIKAIRDKSGAKIQITEGEENVIKITGSKESVESAKELIQENIENWVTLKVAGFIRYSAMLALQFETGTRIQTVRDENFPFVNITGTREKVEIAKKEVKNIYHVW